MSNEVMAVIQLMPGQVGYYDDLSRIHLTMGSPRATIYKGTNVSQIRRSVQSGRLRIISGSLGAEKAPFKVVKKDGKYMLAHNIENNKNDIKENNLKEPIVSEVQVEMPKTQISKEELIPENKNEIEVENEPVPEEVKPEKKRASRKKTASKE